MFATRTWELIDTEFGLEKQGKHHTLSVLTGIDV